MMDGLRKGCANASWVISTTMLVSNMIDMTLILDWDLKYIPGTLVLLVENLTSSFDVGA